MNLYDEIKKAVNESNKIYYLNQTPEADRQVINLYYNLFEKIQQERRDSVKIVCICGSTKFCQEIAVYKWDLEKQGIMAIGLHLLPPYYFRVQPSHQAEYEGVADILDELHFRKIDIANEVFIFNKDGYIGEQTGIEIKYAKALGKKINYLEPIKGGT